MMDIKSILEKIDQDFYMINCHNYINFIDIIIIIYIYLSL